MDLANDKMNLFVSHSLDLSNFKPLMVIPCKPHGIRFNRRFWAFRFTRPLFVGGCEFSLMVIPLASDNAAKNSNLRVVSTGDMFYISLCFLLYCNTLYVSFSVIPSI